jgi:hypothetical protein
MSQKVSFSDFAAAELKSGVVTTIDVPDGFTCRTLTNAVLSYPVEITAIANWNVPPTLKADPTVPERARAWPRVDLMPAGGELLWLLRGSIAFDYSVYPGQSGWFNPGEAVYLAPKDVAASAVAAPGVETRPSSLSESERITEAWPETDVWNRILPLTDKEGSKPDEPTYLVAYAFVKTGSGELETLNTTLESIEVTYE